MLIVVWGLGKKHKKGVTEGWKVLYTE